MEALLQLPLTDVRGLLPDNGGRVRRPAWPHGKVGKGPGDSEFLRGFGALRDTGFTETGDWEGRAQNVDARRAVRLPESFEADLQARLTADGAGPLRIECRGRAYFGSCTSPRGFFQMRLSLVPDGDSAPPSVAAVVDALTSLPLTVGGKKGVPFAAAGEDFAAFVCGQSTRKGGSAPGWSVAAGKPLLGLVVPTDAVMGFDAVPVGGEGTLYATRGGCDVWVLRHEGGDARAASRFLLHVSRMHSERVALGQLAGLIATGRLGASPQDVPGAPQFDLLQQALDTSSRYLSRTVAFGADQQQMLLAIDSDLAIHGAEWDALSTTLGRMRRTVSTNVQQVLVTIHGDVNMGGNIFKNISNSTIINESVVTNSLNTIAQDNQQLADELRALVEAVVATGNKDAAETVEAFTQEAAGPKRKPILRSLWEGIKQAVPVITGLAAAGTQIAALLA